MFHLYNEMLKQVPDKMVIEHLINELDESQYSSWLVIRSNNYLKNGTKYKHNYVV